MKRLFRFAATLVLAGMASAVTMGADGCSPQEASAALVETLGTAAAALEVYEGDTSGAARIETDVSAASSAIAHWKTGTPTQEIAEALNLVARDVGLIPVSAQDRSLIALLGDTLAQLVALYPGATASFMAQLTRTPGMVTAPKTAKQFRQRWNPEIARLKLRLAPLK